MPNKATRRAARTAIQEEVHRIMCDDLSDDLKQESLPRVHDEALDLRKAVIPTDARETLDLIMSIARYEMDVRHSARRIKRP